MTLNVFLVGRKEKTDNFLKLSKNWEDGSVGESSEPVGLISELQDFNQKASLVVRNPRVAGGTDRERKIAGAGSLSPGSVTGLI